MRRLPARAAARSRRRGKASSARRLARRSIAATPASSPSTTSSASRPAGMLRFHPLVIAQRTDDRRRCDRADALPCRRRFETISGSRQASTSRSAREIDGQEERRTYSIVNPEGAGSLHDRRARADRRAHVRVPGAGGASRRSSIEVHDAERELPRRRFAGGRRSYAAFAAGSGITPVLSIASTALASGSREPLPALVRQHRGRAHDVPRRGARAQGPLPDAFLGRLSS